MTLPRVACLCATRDRPEYIGQAVRWFHAQTYPNRELFVIADGDDPTARALAGPDVTVVEVEPGTGVRDKWNHAIRSATRADAFCFWDDDDWHAPDRLARQVEALSRSGAGCVGSHLVRFYDEVDGAMWLYRGDRCRRDGYDAHGRVIDGTRLFSRAFWEERPFSENRADVRGLDGFIDGRAVASDGDATLMVVRRHEKNVSNVSFANHLWEPLPAEAGWVPGAPFPAIAHPDGLSPDGSALVGAIRTAWSEGG